VSICVGLVKDLDCELLVVLSIVSAKNRTLSPAGNGLEQLEPVGARDSL
jgi:hypothetical protein